MSKLREKIYKDFKMEQLGYDFLGYTFESKKELSTHHILPRHSGGKTKKNNLCALNRFTSHNYIHLIEDTDYKVFLELSKYLLEEVSKGEIGREQLLRIADALEFFEFKYRDEEDRHGERLIRPEYKSKRIILKEDL
jgi:hypothetical protein